MVSSSTGFSTEGIVRILDEAVPGRWPSEDATRSMKEGLGGGIGSERVRKRHIRSGYLETYRMARRIYCYVEWMSLDWLADC